MGIYQLPSRSESKAKEQEELPTGVTSDFSLSRLKSCFSREISMQRISKKIQGIQPLLRSLKEVLLLLFAKFCEDGGFCESPMLRVFNFVLHKNKQVDQYWSEVCGYI